MTKRALIIAATVIAVTVTGCGGRVEEAFILTNDGTSQDVATDYLVKILSPQKRLPGQYDKKDIVLLFRDAEHKPFFKKEITLWAAEIKPAIDWKEFPKIRISLESNGQENVYFETIPTK
jgi:hypothetical protein